MPPAPRIREIHGRGADAVLVGGSGLYVSSVLFDFRFPPRDEVLRARLEAELDAHGPGALFARLRDLDPATAAKVDPRNGRRVVRALEVLELGERTHGAMLPEEPVLWHDATRIIGVAVPRDELVARLDARVEAMWRDGILDEVRALRDRGLERGVTARRAIGYAQALAQLAGEIDRSRGDRRDPGAHPPVRPPAGVVVPALRRAALGGIRGGCRGPGRLVGMSIEIRSFDLADTEAVVSLWQATGLTRPWNNPYQDINRKLSVQPELFLVAVAAGAIVGSVMAGYDGHRGWLYYLASDPPQRGAGIGRRLVEAAEERLLRAGLPEGAAHGASREQFGPRLLRGARLRDVRDVGHRQAPDRRLTRPRHPARP